MSTPSAEWLNQEFGVGLPEGLGGKRRKEHERKQLALLLCKTSHKSVN